jgi:hypothetical protein
VNGHACDAQILETQGVFFAHIAANIERHAEIRSRGKPARRGVRARYRPLLPKGNSVPGISSNKE